MPHKKNREVLTGKAPWVKHVEPGRESGNWSAYRKNTEGEGKSRTERERTNINHIGQ